MRAVRCIGLVGLVLAAVAAGPRGSAAPTPSLTPKSWEFDLAFHDPQRIVLTLPGESEPTTYWYLLYTVTNNTGHDEGYYPMFHLVTDTLQIVTGGDEISPTVVDAIRARHRKRYPFFVDPMDVSGVLLQGVDNARVSAAVFRNFDPEASRFTVYVAGLSGEILRMRNPVFDPEKPESGSNSRFFVLRKTLAITYDLPGDERSRKHAVPVRVERQWVMR